MMRRSGTRSKASSRRDVALVQMQLAAQKRNRQWHDFLCGKRDDLQARLRQQGYSTTTKQYGNEARSDTALPGQQGSLDESAEASSRWDATGAQAIDPSSLGAVTPETYGTEPAAEPGDSARWWDDGYHN